MRKLQQLMVEIFDTIDENIQNNILLIIEIM